MASAVKEAPAWIENFRKKSFDAFKKLPPEESRLFAKYDNCFIDFEKFKPDLSEHPIPGDLQKQENCFVQSGANAFTGRTEDLESKGVIFTDVITASIQHRDKLEKLFSRGWKNKFEAFNDAFFANGVFIYVPKGVQIETPFRKISIDNGANTSSKDIIIGGDGSRFSFIEESYSVKEDESLVTGVSDVLLGRGCEIMFGSLQNLGRSVISAGMKRCFCGPDSRISWNTGLFGGKLVRSRVESNMDSAGCVVEDNEVVSGVGDQKFDAMSGLNHVAESTSAVTRMNAVLKDSSQAVIKGMINIGKNAKNSRSYLAEHAMLLGKGAKADAIPGLEIENNDVKATHSASVAKVGEDQMFYLMSRGLDEENSKKLMTNGFLESVIRHMPLPQFRSMVRAAINAGPAGILPEYYEKGDENAGEVDLFGGHYKYR
ncbi:MAG: SufD family Fe-S cluster assembly protein [Candidatus Aenigmarchaeota archaeon]|nr:SufD family Fe-S cluster assembly protein [Candidatus Aenigmarchaeota archaeon]